MPTPELAPIEHRTDEEWEQLARDIVAASGDPDADPEPLAMALKNSAATEAALRDQYWIDLVNHAFDELADASNTDEEA
ncbi:hypothetical protein [Cellulomonas sp. NPDC058312]|uniref:hypothetical protein n=1 Tax=Cellulomonas sp. NPDC058312 TaxID=3346441 RepID=UPI0036F1613B